MSIEFSLDHSQGLKLDRLTIIIVDLIVYCSWKFARYPCQVIYLKCKIRFELPLEKFHWLRFEWILRDFMCNYL